MKENYKFPRYYQYFTLFALLVVIFALAALIFQRQCLNLYYLVLAQNLIFLFVIAFTFYSYRKIRMSFVEDILIIQNSWKHIEINFDEITEIKVTKFCRIKIKAAEKYFHLNHRFYDTAGFFQTFYTKLKNKKPELITPEVDTRFQQVYQNALRYDFNTHVISKYGVLITIMSVLSFFIGMFLIVDFSSIRGFSQISYLLFSLAWPFITWLFFYQQFWAFSKKATVETMEHSVSLEFFKSIPFALVLSAFAEMFILISLMMYFK